jgi:hypothetical protein
VLRSAIGAHGVIGSMGEERRGEEDTMAVTAVIFSKEWRTATASGREATSHVDGGCAPERAGSVG